MTRLRGDLPGTARINRLRIPALRASSRSAVDAVAGRDRARVEAHAAFRDIPRVCASSEARLAPDVDIVCNPLPNRLHARTDRDVDLA